MAEYRLWDNGYCIKEFEATEVLKNMGRGGMTIVLELKQDDEWVEVYRVWVNTRDLRGGGHVV